MKKKNLAVLLISIIFPIVVAVFIGLYSYGSFGNWEKNQNKFVDSIFNEEVETSVAVENYLKFASSHYLSIADQMTVYSDYVEKTEVEAKNGAFSLDNMFTIAPYAFGDEYTKKNEDGSVSDQSYASNMLFLYNFNYNKVTPSKLYFICVQGVEDDDYEHLLKAIEQFDKIWQDEGTTSEATVTGVRQAPTPIYDIHAVLEDDDDSEKVPYVYSFAPNRNYKVTDDEGNSDSNINFENLANCSFAIIETTETDKTTVLASGLIKNIKRNFEALESDPVVKLGYGSTNDNYLKTLNNAGYFGYMLPTLAWQCGLALLISGVISFLFFMTWTYEEVDTKKKFKNKK